MIKWFLNVNATRDNGSQKDFYTGLIFLKSYIQSFAQLCEDFTKINKLHTNTQPRFNLEPYKFDSTLMQNPTT